MSQAIVNWDKWFEENPNFDRSWHEEAVKERTRKRQESLENERMDTEFSHKSFIDVSG